MKKVGSVLVFALLAACLCASGASEGTAVRSTAATGTAGNTAYNGQKVISPDSGVYAALDALYVLEGKALPSTTRPWTVSETVKYLSKVSPETAPELYAAVLEAVDERPRLGVDEAFGMTFSGYASVTGYAHTNTAYEFPFDGMTNFLFKRNNDRPTLQGSWEAWLGRNFYSFFRYQLKNDYDAGTVPFSSHYFNFDVMNLTPEGFTSNLNQREPGRAFVSAGGNHWNLRLGRDRLSTGAGVSGSLIISDTFPYHNILQFTAFGTRYKYSFTMSFFPHMKDETKGIFYYMTHRFECRFLSDRLYAAVNESIMYKNDNGVFDMQYVNPVMYFHNYFIADRANSIVDIELSYAPAGKWNIYGQFVIDQLTTVFEKADGDTETPLALGAMAGLRYTTSADRGIFTANLEGVYTLPYLYLRETSFAEGSTVQDPEDPGLGYIAAFRENRYFLGYPYGGDAAVFDFKAAWEIPGSWEISGEFLFMVHGEKNINSLFRLGDKSAAPSGETSIYSWIELSCRKHITKSVSVCGQFDFIMGAGGTDAQFVLGAEVCF